MVERAIRFSAYGKHVLIASLFFGVMIAGFFGTYAHGIPRSDLAANVLALCFLAMATLCIAQASKVQLEGWRAVAGSVSVLSVYWAAAYFLIPHACGFQADVVKVGGMFFDCDPTGDFYRHALPAAIVACWFGLVAALWTKSTVSGAIVVAIWTMIIWLLAN